MKPAGFQYFRPQSVSDALRLLNSRADETLKILAGGQSLVPLMNFRLAAPGTIVDINHLDELIGIERRNGWLRIGALSRHVDLESSPLVAAYWPMLKEAARHIGHTQIRNAGTLGGSVAHADPSAELPGVLTALDASFALRSVAAGARSVPCSNFFTGQLETCLRPDELLTEVLVPPMEENSGWGFNEFCQRDGDFALAGCACVISIGVGGLCQRAAIALISVGPTPVRASAAEQFLIGSPLTDDAIAEAAGLAVSSIRPPGDLHASSEYRCDLAREMTLRSIREARTRSTER